MGDIPSFCESYNKHRGTGDKWKRTWDGCKHFLGLEKLDCTLEIGLFVVRGEILKSPGHESVLRLIPSDQNAESKDNQSLMKCLAKKKNGTLPSWLPKRGFPSRFPLEWRSHSHIFPPFLVSLDHGGFILASYLQRENGPLKLGQRPVFR